MRLSVLWPCLPLLFFLAAGCSVVPSLDVATGVSPSASAEEASLKNGIFVGEVVTRIKCELAQAFADRLELETSGARNQPRHVPTWLADWTVKADLTLQANEQGGISPSGSYTQFQRSAVNTAAGPTAFPGTALGTFQQFFSVSATANLSEQAVRTELVSFTLSLKELDRWRKQTIEFDRACGIGGRRELLGHLGLEKWVDAALFPVGGALIAGEHKSPNTGTKAAQPQFVSKPTSGTPAAAERRTELGLVERQAILSSRGEIISKATKAETDATNNYSTIQGEWLQVQNNLSKTEQLQYSYTGISTGEALNKLGKERSNLSDYWDKIRLARNCALRQLCGSDFGYCGTFNKEDQGKGELCRKGLEDCGCTHDALACSQSTTSGAIQSAKCAIEQARKIDDGLNDADLTDAYKSASKAAQDAKDSADNVKVLSDYGQKFAQQPGPKPPDPPIDSIGHSVQFVLAYGGGITPSWTLIAWKGPGLTGPTASGNVNRTHLLQLALGSPNAEGTSGEQSRVLTNQTIFISHQ
jgi:hypothetical protein